MLKNALTLPLMGRGKLVLFWIVTLVVVALSNSSTVSRIAGEAERADSLAYVGVVNPKLEIRNVKAEGLFFAIGHIPATGFLKISKLELDTEGYILTQAAKSLSGEGKAEWPTMTNIHGVFAAGDCVDHRYRQAGTAVGMGIQAALDAERWLASR